MRLRFALVAALAVACVAKADPDVGSMYDISTEGSSKQVKAGEKGKVVIAIHTKEGAHVSADAPLKIELSSKELKADKEKLTLKDSTAKKGDSHELTAPTFEVAFAAQKPGKASMEAKMTFFICTDKLCARQQKTLTFPVDVN